MKRVLVILCLLLSLPASRAHVGSPNVFFEGNAGAQQVRVVVRPPATLPGLAQVDVRVLNGVATNVLLQPVLFEAGAEAAPAAIRAPAVAGETNLFNGSVWLFQRGSYSLRVNVESPQGSGIAVVPVTSAAMRLPAMSIALRTLLLMLGGVLFIGAVWLVGAGAREYLSEPEITLGQSRRPSIAAATTAILLGGAIYACAVRWQKMDREFRNNALYKPVPVAATVRTNGNLKLLHITPATSDAPGGGWDTLAADHGKLMHLFLLREPNFDTFAHLHPVRRDQRTFENVLPPLAGGHYQLYAEITRENGLNETLISDVLLPNPIGVPPQLLMGSNMLNEVLCQSVTAPIGNAAQPFALDADDSWHVAPETASRAKTTVSQLMGGWRMLFQNSGALIENKETSLRFALVTPEGKPAPLQHYMGMRGHAVVRRNDGAVFTHLHPVGTISMAAQELFARGETAGGSSTNQNTVPAAAAGTTDKQGNGVAFPYAFPRPGEYRLWVQVRANGRVFTGVFNTDVQRAD